MNNQEWRLPTIEELKSLFWGELPDDKEFGRVTENPAVKAAYREVFAKQSSAWFWSSSDNIDLSDIAWYVCFLNGSVYYCDKDYAGRVRLVRGAISKGGWLEGDEPHTRYSVMGDVVTDNKTGLEWKRQPESGTYTWYEAMKLFNKEEDKMTTTTIKELEQKLTALQAELDALKAKTDPTSNRKAVNGVP